MAYTKQNFANGVVLDATQLNNMDNQIAVNEAAINELNESKQPKGNYLTAVPSGYATEDYVKNKIAEAELGGEEVDLSGYAQKSELPTKTSDLVNDSGFITSYTETDPTVPAWAKASTKPTYTASEVGAEVSGTASSLVSKHNSDEAAHADIRELISELFGQSAGLTAAQVSSLADVVNAIGAFIVDNGTELVAAFNTAWGIDTDDGSGDADDGSGGDNTGDITVYELPGWTLSSNGLIPYRENSGVGFSAYFKVDQNTTYRVVEHGTHNRLNFIGFRSEDWTHDNGKTGTVIANSSTNPGIVDLMEFEFNSGDYHWVYVYLAADNTVAPKITVTEVTE